MEIKREKKGQKEKTLSGLFLRFVTLFCVNTILIFAVVFLLLLCAAGAGFLLPANEAELQLTEHAAEISRAGDAVGEWIPKGCTYGVYDAGGIWLNGTFSKREQKSAWEHYEKGKIYSEYKGYYCFIGMEDGSVCIVKYHLVMRYADEALNEYLPAPEIMMPLLDVILFLAHAVWISRRFARKVQLQLRKLQEVTEKVAGNDLEFEAETSDIQEINEIMASLGHMKDSLQHSLKRQWDMEQQKQQQLAALAHDIKTPLTIIGGNAELLREQKLSEESRECAAYILENANEIERYLEAMRQILRGAPEKKEQAAISCERLIKEFQEAAKQLAAAEKMSVSFDVLPFGGVVCCEEADILRAWNNLIGNAAEYTDRRKGIAVSIRRESRDNRDYFVAVVRDYGVGFSAKDLQCAAQEFYSGDVSRHDRKHFGLGLSIAKKFAEEQGGFLEYGNCEVGAEAGLWLVL